MGGCRAVEDAGRMVAQDVLNSAEISAGDDAVQHCKELTVEVRGSRTNGVLPTSVCLQMPCRATVSRVKAKLEACAQAPHRIAASQIKLVHAGRALADDEVLSRIAAEGFRSSSDEVCTLHAVLLGPGEKSAAPKPFKVGSVNASPAGPSPVNSPRYYSSPSSVASSPQMFSHPSSPASSGSAKWMEGLKKQVEDGMRKAFFDLIEKSLSEEQPDAEWIARQVAARHDFHQPQLHR